MRGKPASSHFLGWRSLVAVGVASYCLGCAGSLKKSGSVRYGDEASPAQTAGSSTSSKPSGSAAASKASNAESAAGKSSAGKLSAGRSAAAAKASRRPLGAAAQQPYEGGLVHLRKGENAAAEAELLKALRADGGSYQVLGALGIVADRAGRTDQALEYYRRSLQLQPDYEVAVDGIVAIYLRRGNAPQALEFVAPLASRWPANLDLQVTHASVLVQSAQYSQAWAVARAALRQDERFVPALVVLAKASVLQGRIELAESIVEQGLAIDAQSAGLRYWKGRLEQKAGRMQEAMTQLQKAIELRPDFLEARIALGRAYLVGGNYTEALQQFEAAVRLAPGVAAVYLDLAEAYRSNRQWSRAKAAYDQALKLQPELPEAHFNLGLLYLTAADGFPGMDRLTALRNAKRELTIFHEASRARRDRSDPSETYMRDLDRQIEREQRRLTTEAARKESAAKESAKPAEEKK